MKWLRNWINGKEPAWTPTHRHRKGGLYRKRFVATLEADRSSVVVYDDAEGTIWVRSAAEFGDGRFTDLASDRS